MIETNGRRMPWRLALFVAAYMLATGTLALRQGNSEFVIYAGSMVVFIIAIVLMHARFGFRTSTLWLLAIWGLLHMAGGTVPIPPDLAQTESPTAVLYALRPWPDLPRYDQVVHAFGFFSATLACHDAILAAAGRVRASLAVVAALMGMGLGAVNEVLEFATTRVLEDTNVGGYVNTGWDLVSNTVGAVTAGTLRLIAPPRD